MVKFSSLHDNGEPTESTPAERQIVSDMLRHEPDLLKMLGLP